jgi:hypothetical protein
MGSTMKQAEVGMLFAEILCREWKKENEKVLLKFYIAMECYIVIVNAR